MFRQIVGIPMGSDPAPFFANLFLFFYESEWITKFRKENYIASRKLNNTFRFIDDLITINDNNIFEANIHNIYPNELQLKKENNINTEATFLDLKIKIDNNKFMTSLYDKRDNFNFDIVRMPHKCSNIPSKMFNSTISAELLRISKASTSYCVFLKAAKVLIHRMTKQGAAINTLSFSLRKMLNNHSEISTKFGKGNLIIVKKILSI